ASAGLVALFDGAKDAGEFTSEARAEAGDLIAAALQAERDAIAGIESALFLVNESH
ncbi:MAG: hypothetical protein IH961_10770, partial [Chloroflexi bacterium]|nr:hypothetical protein [Chloroflexota bacterium]